MKLKYSGAYAPLLLPILSLIGIIYLNLKEQEYQNHRLDVIRQKTVPEIAAAQQSRLGINHFLQPCYVSLSCLHKFGCCGTYNSDKDTITIDSCIVSDDAETKRVISHELGHFYADKLNESLGKGNWPSLENKNSAQQAGIMLVSEGIAMYFENSTKHKHDFFKDSEWPKLISDFTKSHVKYIGGFHLVRPIIDKHKIAGIEYLITNPPEEKDLLDLPAYQKRALEKLKK